MCIAETLFFLFSLSSNQASCLPLRATLTRPTHAF